ncbi:MULTISPECIES: response regulator transcription factor [unclassified Enterococcus]|uniref:response regulator transcription factor n=1 Tax=unclassified Enterococcus TaxID=2608891 RepID=UPI001A9B83A1|nr:response regulator [Enterococcus sp. DIV1271a]MBO1300792.1 response regulator [Enterococcus sp. DIV1271a]
MKNIVLIDDEQTILHGLSTLIDWPTHGFQLKGAFSKPLEALEFIKKEPLDIIVTDLMMPDLNGIELSRLIKEEQPEAKILVLSSYDDFQLVKDSFKEGVSDYLLKPKLNPSEFLASLKSLVEQSAEVKKPRLSELEKTSQAISNYLAGSSLDTGITRKPFKHDAFFLVYCEEKPAEKHRRSQELSAEAPRYTNQDVSVFPYFTTANDVGYLINAHSREAFEQFVNRFQEDHQTDACLYVLSGELTFENIYPAFLSLKQKSNGQCFYLNEQSLISEEQLLPLLSSYEQQTKSYLTKIMNKDFLSAIEELESYMKNVLEQRLQPSYLKHEIINRLYALINAIAEEHEKRKEIMTLKITIPAQITQSDNWEELVVIVNNTTKLLREVTTTFRKDNSDVLTLIYDYVQDHYHQDLSLQTLSEKYHFSYSYLSTIFTEKYGINFTKYLKKVRINQAKMLLKESNLSLSDICQQTGFTEIGYFSRVFKEETGLTPSQYRKGMLTV